MQLQQREAKTALIIGGNGTFGSAVGQELLAQGWKVKVLLRNNLRRPKWMASTATIAAVQIFTGDCSVLADVERAAQEVDLLVYAANPSYSHWQQQAFRMLEPSVIMAEKLQLQILFPGNIYAYDPEIPPVIDEFSELTPPTGKGVIRQAMERRLQRAGANGATVTLIRCGDFIAKDSASSWMQHLLSAKKSHWNLANPSVNSGGKDHYHSYVWVEDLAKNALALVDYDSQYNGNSFNQWCDPGLFVSHQDWLQAFAKSDIPVKSSNFPWWGLKLMGLFSPEIREVWKMRYLWRQSLALEGSKIRRALGERYKCQSLGQVVRALTGTEIRN
ncbi:MAG: hypothetical protein OFPI_35890 [Osedax symbiont Rs2]|nr:MAG: hypothetical protein OFPI_35890 [Osedax symbiont Rs2]